MIHETNNPHEIAARTLKISKLIAWIDWNLRVGTKDGKSIAAVIADGDYSGDTVAHALASQTDQWWEMVSRRAGVRIASQTTRQMIIDSYRDRRPVDTSDDPFMGLV